MSLIEISPIDLRDYAISLGWKLIPEALKDGLYVLNSPFDDFRQLVYAKDSSEVNIQEQIHIALRKLSAIYDKTEFQLQEEIRAINDDVISLRYFSETKSVNSISFEEALEAIEGTKQIILAAASNVIAPATYHPRLSRNEPNSLLKKIRFRHTEEGSFILKVSCPVELESSSQVSLFGEEVFEPYTRKTFSLINKSASELLNAIESDSIEDLVAEQKQSISPFLSYNYCSALIDLYDEERELPFELRFRWSPNTARKLAHPQLPNSIKFSYDIKSKLELAKSYLKPEISLIEDTFIATVESLNGNLGSDGKRYGEVRLAILIESSIVNAKASLDADKYEIADSAHMQAGSYVIIKGRLHPGKQLRLLDNITDFKIVTS